MICKIVFNTNEADIDLICEKLSTCGSWLFVNKILYFNTHQPLTKNKLKNIFIKANARENVIFDLTLANALEEGNDIYEWVRDYFFEEALLEMNSKENEIKRKQLADKLELAQALYQGMLQVVPKNQGGDNNGGDNN